MRNLISNLRLHPGVSMEAARVRLPVGLIVGLLAIPLCVGGMVGCQSGPDDDVGEDAVDVEVDAVGEADADDVDQDPNIGAPMN